MKELTLEQMENLQPGGGSRFWSCVSSVTGGMGVLGGLAAIGIYAMTPVGWGLLALSAISLAAGVISDPTACDE